MQLTQAQIAYGRKEGCGALAEQILGADSSIDAQFKLSQQLKAIVWAKERKQRARSFERQLSYYENYGRIRR